MIALAERPTLLIARWPEHGDLWVVMVDDQRPALRAADLCTLLEIPVQQHWNERLDEVENEWPRPGLAVWLGEPREAYYMLDVAVQIASDEPSYLTADFLSWLDEFLASMNLIGVERVVDAAKPLPEAARGRNHSVRRAALLLNADPAINTGQDYLFETMRNLGWIRRHEARTWVPEDTYVKLGWLVRKPTRVPGRKELYPQIRITDAGLHELHQRLGGIGQLTIDDPPQLTLLEF